MLGVQIQMFSLSKNIMLVGMAVGVTATVGFHISVKEPSEEDNVEGLKLSSMEVQFEHILFRFIFSDQESKHSKPKINVLSWLKNPQLYLVSVYRYILPCLPNPYSLMQGWCHLHVHQAVC